MSDRTDMESAPSTSGPDDGIGEGRASAAHAPDLAGGRGWTLAIVSIATFMLMLDLTVVNVALPDMRVTFDASFPELQWVLDAYALGLAVLLLTAGSTADRLGRKRVFNLGLIVFVLASLSCGIAANPVLLSLARGVQGLGAATLFAIGPALIGHEYRGKDRGTAFGVFGAVVGLAIAFGPLIGGAITDNLTWRWIFLLNVPVGAVALLISRRKMRESRADTVHPTDWWGLLTFSGALTLLVLGFLRGEALGWTSAPVSTMFVAAVVLFAVFFVIERLVGEATMLDLALFRNVTFNGISVVTLLCGAATISAIFLQISYVQNVLGFSAWQAGIRFLPLTLTLFVAAAIAGALTTKIPPRILVGVALAAIAAGLAAATRIQADSHWSVLLPSMILLGAGMGLFNPPRASLSIAVAEPSKAGMASGIGETFQQVGVAVGVAAFGALFQARVSHTFKQSPAAHILGHGADRFAAAVAAGGGNTAATQIHQESLTTQLQQAGLTAFTHALTDVMWACAAVALLGSIIAFTFIRTRDLHESALTLPDAEVPRF